MSEMRVFVFIMNLAILALIGIFLPIIPALTRKAFLFGVSVPESAQEHPEARRMKRRYVAVSLYGVAVMLAVCVAQYLLKPELTLLASMYLPLLIIPVQFIAFVPNWKRALRLKSENGWHTPERFYAETASSHSRGTMREIPWLYYIISLVIILIGVVIALYVYPSIPDPMPTHFDINGVADGWSKKSLFWALLAPMTNFGLCGIMWVSNIGMVRSKLQVSVENPALSFAQHRAYRRLLGHCFGISTIGFAAGMGLLGVMLVKPQIGISIWLPLIILLIPILPLCIFPVKAGQGGCKLKPKYTNDDGFAPGYRIPSANNGRGNDAFWILGMFYHNANDPAVLVEDRFGGNIGLNYAHTGAKIAVAVMFAIIAATYVWATWVLGTLPL